jgi:hypothetical protein
MSDRSSTFERTRRAVLRAAAASALGIGATGGASGHPGAEKDGGNVDGPGGEPFGLDEGLQSRNAATVGYHSIGGVGSAGRTGQRAQRNGGDRTSEMRVHGDIGVISFRASDEDDPGRRLAVLEVTEFNEAATRKELEDAELTVLGITKNANAETNGATDVKFSDDGNYAFLATQALYPVLRGSNGSTEATDPRASPQATGGVVAVDISDPGDPRTIDSVTEAFSTGVHNVFHHRIDGTEYVFACKDAGLISPDSGVYVLRFDRDPGKLTVVNRWTADGNTARGEVGPEHRLSYVHDVEVHDDPRTGRPTAYVADWDRGMRVLDVSDPTNIEHVGQFDMYQSHFAAPFPELVETSEGTKRVAVASHEEPDERFDQRIDTVNNELYNTPHEDKTNPNSTGTVFLVDCDGIYPEDGGDARSEGDGPRQLGELDNWTWKNADTEKGFDDGLGRKERLDAIEQDTFSFQLSPHNSQPTVHEIDGETQYVIHQGHYHGGVRYLRVLPGTDEGLTGDARRDYQPETNPNAAGRDGSETIGWINNTTDWNVVDVGHARPKNEETGNLSPDFWSSVEHNGLSFHGDRSAGVWVTYYDGETALDSEGEPTSDDGKPEDIGAVPLGKPRPQLEVSRSDDGDLFTAGQTNRVDIEVTAYERGDAEAASVTVRDRVPTDYEVVGGDATETYPRGVRTAVEFETEVAPGETTTLTYFVQVGEDTGESTVGPVEVSADGREWAAVANTVDTAAEAGVGTDTT